jgi:hypothetical protein
LRDRSLGHGSGLLRDWHVKSSYSMRLRLVFNLVRTATCGTAVSEG